MQARSVNPFLALFVPTICLLGLAGILLTMEGAPLATVAIAVLVGALFVLLLNPPLALGLIAATRFTFEMAWDERVMGMGVLDLLGAGVPLVAPRATSLPLRRPCHPRVFIIGRVTLAPLRRWVAAWLRRRLRIKSSIHPADAIHCPAEL